VIYLPRLGTSEIDYEEARRIYPAITMLNTGDWLIPEFEGQKYFRKPPLQNWLIAISFKITGTINAFTARLPAAAAVLFLSIFLLCVPLKLPTKTKFTVSVMILTTIELFLKCERAEIDGIYAVLSGLAVISWLGFHSHNINGFKLWLFPSFFLGLGLLLKGPMILLFFYIVVFSVLINEKKIGKLLSFSHILSLIFCLAIFFTWHYLASKAMPQSESEKISGTWSTEILYRLNPENINWGKWIRNIFGGLLGCLPWILFLPLTEKHGQTQSNEFQARYNSPLLKAIGVFFLLTALLPATKARYFMPAYPLIILLAANNIANFTNIKALKIGILVLKVLAVLIWGFSGFYLFLFSLLLCLLKWMPDIAGEMRFIETFDKSVGAYDFIPMAACFAIFSACLFLFLKRTVSWKKNEGGVVPEEVAPFFPTCAASLLIFANAYLFPFERLNEKNRPLAEAVNQNFIPSYRELKLFNIGLGEPFLFYLKMPFRETSRADISSGNLLLLMPSSTFEKLLEYATIAQGKYKLIASFQRKKEKYSLVEIFP
jgi:hypothetical protein